MVTFPLTQVNCRQLEKVFQQELYSWSRELFWDHGPSIKLIKKYISSQNLSGYAVGNTTGTILGYGYYVIHSPVAYIGNIYVQSEYASPSVYAKLIDTILDKLEESQTIRRIECQISPFNCSIAPIFKAHRFVVMNRYFLIRELEQLGDKLNLLSSSSHVRILPWSDNFFYQAANTIYDSYQDSPDYILCHDYQSQEGCIRFLNNLIESPGCGKFNPQNSYLALNTAGEVCGVLITSKIGSQTGMVPQISVKKAYQGKGVGSMLLKTYFQQGRKNSIKRLILSVSELNFRARKFYQHLGFYKLKSFYAFIKETTV